MTWKSPSPCMACPIRIHHLQVHSQGVWHDLEVKYGTTEHREPVAQLHGPLHVYTLALHTPPEPCNLTQVSLGPTEPDGASRPRAWAGAGRSRAKQRVKAEGAHGKTGTVRMGRSMAPQG